MVPVLRVPFVSMVPLFSCSVVSAMFEHADAPVGSADILYNILSIPITKHLFANAESDN